MTKQKNLIWKFYDPKFEYQPMLDDYNEGWVGLRAFGYDLIANLKPRQIVELGTYKGTSLFSFSQAIKDNRIDSQIIGIDTWEGDFHTGFYGEEVYSLIKKIIKKHYPKVKINLYRKTFDNVINRFKDNSIGLLHIDGLHTYEAVKHDFESWKDKVSDNGIVIFHDIHYFNRGFGVYKYWETLKSKYPTLELKHSNGLGILFKNREVYEKIKNYESFWQIYYPIKASNYELSNKLNKATDGKLINEFKKEISRLNQILIRQNQDIDSLQSQLSSITTAKFFRIWQKYCNIRDSLLNSVK